MFLQFIFWFLPWVLLRVLSLCFHSEGLLHLRLSGTLEIIWLSVHSFLHIIWGRKPDSGHILLALATGVFGSWMFWGVLCLGRLDVEKREIRAHLGSEVERGGGFVRCWVLVRQFGVIEGVRLRLKRDFLGGLRVQLGLGDVGIVVGFVGEVGHFLLHF